MVFSKTGAMAAVCFLAANVFSFGSATQSERRRVAEGEYLMTLEEQYGTRTEVTEWRETWTLWKVEGGGFEVDSAWRVQTEGEEIARFETWIALSLKFHPFKFRGLPGKQLMPISCDLGKDEIRCETKGERPRFALTGPYDLYYPSPWFLASFAGRAKPDTGEPTPVQLVIMDRGGPKSLIGFGAGMGQIVFVGEEALSVAGREFNARKFELKAEPFPNWFIWTSKEGIALALQDERKKILVELARYNQHGSF